MRFFTIVATGRTFYAETTEDFVCQLAKQSFAQAETMQLWLAETTERVELFTGKRIRSWNANVFVADLIDLGLVQEETRN